MSNGKKGVKLARYDLVPARSLWLLAEVYGRGAQKYADRNWEKGYEWSKSFQAAQRHLWQWWSGEQNDPEDGQHHLAAAAWHIFALLEYEDTHPEYDNRPRSRELRSELLNPEEIAAAKLEVEDDRRAWPGVGTPKIIEDIYGGINDTPMRKT